MGRCKWNKKNGAGKEMQEDAYPGLMSQQDGEIEVNATGSEASPEPPECFIFSVRMTKEGAATAHSITLSPSQFIAPIWQSDAALSAHPSGYKGGSRIEPTAWVHMDGVHCHRHVQRDWRPHWSSCLCAGTSCPILWQMISRWRAFLWGGTTCCFLIDRRHYLDRKLTVVEVTILTIWEGHRAVMQAAVKNHVETRGQGSPYRHHITHQPSGVARGHNVQYFKQETSAPSLGNPVREMTVALPMCVVDSSEDMELEESDRHSLEDHIPSQSLDRGSDSDHNSVLSRSTTILSVSSHSNQSVQTNGGNWAGRRPHVKINLTIFKDEQSKDAVTYLPGNGMWLFTGDQGVETKLFYHMCTNLYWVFSGNWPEVWVRILPCRRCCGWTLWSSVYLWWSEQGAVHAPSRLSRGQVWVWCIAWWHVWIIHTEFPRCIRDENMEGVKCNCLHKGLRDDYQVNASSQDGRGAASYICWIAQSCEADREMIPSQTPHITAFSVRWIEQCVGHCIQ